MRKVLLLVSALLLCGFTVITPEMVREREDLCAVIIKRYGEKRLSAFVRDVIAQHPVVDDARLANSKVGEKWAAMDWNPFWHVISVDWAMAVKAQKKGEDGLDVFTFFWACDDEHGILVEGRRDESGTLVFVSIRKEATAKLSWN